MRVHRLLWAAQVAIAVALLVCATSSSASAHTVSRSHSSWVIDGHRVRVSVRVPLVEIKRQTPDAAHLRSGLQAIRDAEVSAALTKLVPEAVRLNDAEAGCKPVSKPILRGLQKSVRVSWSMTCLHTPAAQIHSELFVENAPSHLHFASLTTQGQTRVAVLSTSVRDADFSSPDKSAKAGGFLAFVRSGFYHVTIGVDHILFVLGLLLLGGGVRRLLAVSAGFTLGHSVTLALATTGVMAIEPTAVEIVVLCTSLFTRFSTNPHLTRDAPSLLL
jgi:hypothetical protein